MMISQADPKRRFDEISADVRNAVARVFDRGIFVLGEEVESFEHEFASFLGAKHVVGVSSGTAALSLALTALGIGRGDEVITPSLTSPATAVEIEEAGATPVFVDVDRLSRCIDTDALAAAIGSRTAAVLPVHLHGCPAAMEEIVRIAGRHGLSVVEDCAHAHGATIRGRRLGTFGHAAAFSFYPTKNLGAAGDGGAVAVSDPAIADRIRRLRNYGCDEARTCVGPGSNQRLDELQAAILRACLPHLDRQNAERRQLAAAYRSNLAGQAIGLPLLIDGAVFHQYAVTLDGRDGVRSRLSARGIGTGIHYPLGVHRHPRFSRDSLHLPVTDALAAELLSLPIQPEVARGRIDIICESLLQAVKDTRL